MSPGRPSAAEIPAHFGEDEWREEVQRLRDRSPARVQAERARREVEASKSSPDFLKCEVHGDDRTRLPGCVKLYLPLGRHGPSAAPFGFVFQLARDSSGTLAWNFIAFGERHPENPFTRTVYERAHRRLHGRYPS
jgi:hypothetical protein